MFHMSFVQIAEFIWLQGQKRVNFREKNVKKIFSETIRWIKPVLFMDVYDIILYINCVFGFVQIRTGCCGNFFHFCVYTWPIIR